MICVEIYSANQNNPPIKTIDQSAPPIFDMSDLADLNIKLSKSNIDFVKPKLGTEPDIDETKEIIRYQIEEKQNTLYEQLRLNEEIKHQEFEQRFKPKAPKALDEEDVRFIEERKKAQLSKEKLKRDQISMELNKFEAEVKKLNEIPKEDLEKKQKEFFQQPVFAKKRKEIDQELMVEMDVQPIKQKKLTKEASPKVEKKNGNVKKTSTLVEYEDSD